MSHSLPSILLLYLRLHTFVFTLATFSMFTLTSIATCSQQSRSYVFTLNSWHVLMCCLVLTCVSLLSAK